MYEIEEVKKFNFSGIQRIEIPYSDSDFVDTQEASKILDKYLPQILSCHKNNAEKIAYLWNYKKGMQDIMGKQRLYVKDSENNNIILENHAYKQVSFKVGFLTSTPRDYTQKEDVDSDDIKYLKRYFTDTCFFSKDKEMREWAYTVGVGIDSINFRNDLIEKDENGNYRFLTSEEGFDINYEAPFEYNVLSPIENFVVYSSNRKKEPLFCVSISKKDFGKDKTIDIRYELFIETKYAYYKGKSDLGYAISDQVVLDGNKILHYLPFVEHSPNVDRLGVVELNLSAYNSLNVLRSSIADMIVDNANAILVFKNTDIDGEQVEEMKRAGAIVISNQNINATADLSTITIEIPFSGLNQYYESLLSQCYSVASVPLANQQSTSGGDTGDARRLGGGWEDAFQTTNNEKTTFLQTDIQVLKNILYICKQFNGNPINDIHASEIEIKYNISQNANLLVKAQSIYELWQCKFPKKHIVQASGLFNDIDTVSKDWEENEKVLIEEEKNNETQTSNNSQE